MAVFDRIAAGGLLNHARSHAAVTRAHVHLRSFAAVALAAALSACGGSGDDQGGTPYSVPTTQTQPGSVSGRIQSASDGLPVAGATVTLGTTTLTTGADGTFNFPDLTQVDRILVTVTAPGYAPSVRIASVTGGRVTSVPVQLVPVGASASIDAAVGGTVTVPGSTAQVTFPAGAIVTLAGAAPTQPVVVQVTPVSPAQDPNLATGDYRTTSNNATAWLESFGALAVVLTDAGGGSYTLAAGQTATIRIPAASRATTLPTSIPLYAFNDSTGLWESTGTATLTGTAPNQYYEGTVGQISTWGASQVTDTVQVTGCVQDATGHRVGRARIDVDGVTYSGMTNVLADRSGNFSVPMRRDSTVVLSARSGTLLSNARAVTATSSNVSLGSSCLVLAEGAIGIRLTWGAAPL
ncbi:MAG: carboxypeptidase regulatory-like domain-containing protein, partial [Rhizobacter sp.]|nr:carboxypeptidase regulatory-like domain-containing protein [Rhizobacter sp.]